MVVDVHARTKVAQGLERYVKCEIDNDSLAVLLLEGEKTDTACYELRFAIVDILYSIWDTHKNEGKWELSDTARRMIQRWVRFLGTQEEWPLPSRKNWNCVPRFFGEVLRLLTEFASRKSPLSNEYWPFKSLEDWRRFEAN
jgi:hypothetical protein